MLHAHKDDERLLTRKEAAKLLGVKEMTLAIWKTNNRYNLPVVKVGRLAKYRYSDLMAFIEKRTVNRPTDCESVSNKVLI